ncbi:MAG: 3-phosphoshikimate 1-carboxyvinyltransferase [candidate division Zixibacteria bacterium]|nr:3-phosphoshikimate 1-carboxyvinyltransferase [candidate division Zixibacteria bacterium]
MHETITPCRAIKGTIHIPGDKSITHRALLTGSISQGRVEISNPSPAMDCESTVNCLKQLGVQISRGNNKYSVKGRGLFGLKKPNSILDAGNSGTTARLLSGILSGQGFDAILTGDESLSQRPMERIILPLRQMGAEIRPRQGDNLLPLEIRGRKLNGITYEIPLPSAQVKSSLLLAGLLAIGKTTLTGRLDSRDHTERLFDYLGIGLENVNGRLLVEGGQEIQAKDIRVPGDFSAAMFFIAAAVVTRHSEIVIKNVGLNPTRTKGLDVLRRMGADLEVFPEEEQNQEPVGTITARSSKLKGTTITAEEVPYLIDEIPALAVAAALADGNTTIAGAGELRVKESDRLSALASELKKMRAEIKETPAGLEIYGRAVLKGAVLDSHHDHRIAMALAAAGLAAEGPSRIIGSEWTGVSFPGFFNLLSGVRRQ